MQTSRHGSLSGTGTRWSCCGTTWTRTEAPPEANVRASVTQTARTTQEGRLSPSKLRTNFADGPAVIADVNADGIVEVVATGNVYDCSTGYPPSA